MKKFLVVLVMMSTVLLSSCVTYPYYGYGGVYSYSAPQYSYWGFYNEPVRFYGYHPSYVYDPFGFWPSLVQGAVFGLGWLSIHRIFGGHHHH